VHPLLCEFFGLSHPKCKNAVVRSEQFLEQFKIPEDEELKK
jgi:hypothetical protein